MIDTLLNATAIPATAGDAADPRFVAVRAGEPVHAAATRLVAAGVTAAPVLDADGRPVGLFSLSDAVRGLAAPPASIADGPRTCLFQDTLRGQGGRELSLCTLAVGRCPFQREGVAEGAPVTMCAVPHAVAADWQVVPPPALPAADVRHHMTAEPVVVRADAPITEVARLLAEHAIHQVPVVDDDGRLTGVVSALRALDILRRLLADPPTDEE